jgi:hypothetical protein
LPYPAARGRIESRAAKGGHSGPYKRHRNVSYNGGLGAGASTTFGFLGSWNGTNNVPALSCTAS